MALQQQSRSLEVVVLAGRGLSSQIPSGARRKVQLTLVSTKDPNGEAFAAKVSPWSVARQGKLRFGSAGLQCSFPLSRGRGAPDLVADVRFTESAELRVRLLASSVNSDALSLRTAAEFLPSSFMSMANKELDEATAQLEGEVRVPLTNILSGRVGFAADRALGGWVPLRRCLPDEDAADAGTDGLPPALWMQMYALPDHKDLIPSLKTQLTEEVARQPASDQSPAQVQPAKKTATAVAAAAAAAERSACAPTAAAPRWGPKATTPQGTAQQQSANFEDLIDVKESGNLIDVTLEDAQEPTLLPDRTSSDLLSVDFGSTAAAGNLPIIEQGLPRVGSLLDDLAPPGPAVQNGTPSVSSAFSFIESSGPAGNAPTAASGPSAFGFIAGSSGDGELDLAALYAASPQAPKIQHQQQQQRDFSALMNYADVQSGKSAAASKSLESLEQSIMADLKL